MQCHKFDCKILIIQTIYIIFQCIFCYNYCNISNLTRWFLIFFNVCAFRLTCLYTYLFCPVNIKKQSPFNSALFFIERLRRIYLLIQHLRNLTHVNNVDKINYNDRPLFIQGQLIKLRGRFWRQEQIEKLMVVVMSQSIHLVQIHFKNVGNVN